MPSDAKKREQAKKKEAQKNRNKKINSIPSSNDKTNGKVEEELTEEGELIYLDILNWIHYLMTTIITQQFISISSRDSSYSIHIVFVSYVLNEILNSLNVWRMNRGKFLIDNEKLRWNFLHFFVDDLLFYKIRKEN